jgi:hypothetical protein
MPPDARSPPGLTFTGTIVSGPRFKPGAPLHGTYLSHTHLILRGDAHGRAYDVAIDDAFANGYRHSQRSVPAPLNTIKRLRPSSRSNSAGCYRDWERCERAHESASFRA